MGEESIGRHPHQKRRAEPLQLGGAADLTTRFVGRGQRRVRMPQNGRARSPLRNRERLTPASRASPTRKARSAQPFGSGVRSVTGRGCLSSVPSCRSSPQAGQSRVPSSFGKKAQLRGRLTLQSSEVSARYALKRTETMQERPRKLSTLIQGSLFVCVSVDFQKQTGLKSGITTFGVVPPAART